jgi:hypothetical protein
MTRKGVWALTIAFLASVSTGAGGQTKPSIVVEACSISLTASGQSAAFQGAAFYEVRTTTTGEVESLRAIRLSPVGKGLLDLDGAEACIKRWRLEPSTTYHLGFSFGTTAPFLKRWTMKLTGGSIGVLYLALPRGDGTPKAP